MSLTRAFFAGQFDDRGDTDSAFEFISGRGLQERKIQTLDEPIQGTVPLQHTFSQGTQAIEKLPIVRKCVGYIADTINETTPRIVRGHGRGKHIVAEGDDLPRWIRQPSGEFVLAELCQQAVWSAFVDGNIRLLATLNKNRQPTAVYVGTSNLITRHTDAGLVYVDYSHGYPDKYKIIANSLTHRRRLSVPGRPMGIGEFEPAKTLIDTALHAQDMLAKFFGSNMHLDLIFSHDGAYVRNAGRELMRQLAKKHVGGRNAFRPIVSSRKWKIDRIRDSNQANQVVELVQMINSNIVSSVFGIDPLVFSLGSMDGKSLTYQNASNLRSQVWLQAVKPIANLIAGCISDYLPPGQRLEFSAEDLLRGSPSDRANLISKMATSELHHSNAVNPIFHDEEFRDVLGHIGEGPLQKAPPAA